MGNKCQDCKHYCKAKEGYNCGTCGYQVPGYLKIGISGGGFVSGYEAKECGVFEKIGDSPDKPRG